MHDDQPFTKGLSTPDPYKTEPLEGLVHSFEALRGLPDESPNHVPAIPSAGAECLPHQKTLQRLSEGGTLIEGCGPTRHTSVGIALYQDLNQGFPLRDHAGTILMSDAVHVLPPKRMVCCAHANEAAMPCSLEDDP